MPPLRREHLGVMVCAGDPHHPGEISGGGEGGPYLSPSSYGSIYRRQATRKELPCFPAEASGGLT